jgi:hypothetical protein
LDAVAARAGAAVLGTVVARVGVVARLGVARPELGWARWGLWPELGIVVPGAGFGARWGLMVGV